MSVDLDEIVTSRLLHPASRTAASLDVGAIYTHEQGMMHRLLDTLAAAGDTAAMRLILVDNASAEGVGRFTGYVESTSVVRNHRRLAYAANLNRIVHDSTAPFLLLLNTDVYFDAHEPAVAKMLDFMRRNPRCGIAGCRVYRADGRYAHPARRFQDLPVILARRFGLGGWMPRVLDDYLYRDCRREETWPCQWLSGCFMMVRREAIREVGPFDTEFGKYFEDVDICLRMAMAGWQVMFHGETYCYHLESRASRHLLSPDACRHVLAYLRFLRKWGYDPARHLPDDPAVRRAA